ncbi:unnamed protein product [Rhizophagus irregularis]|nr:unnamed protein product [Rhizophagus irregularis]
MQRVQEEESHVGYTPPPPYTLSTVYIIKKDNSTTVSLPNPYPATVIPPDADFRLAQKLQDEEYAQAQAHWVDTNPQQDYYSNVRSGETSISTNLPRAPMPPIPEHYQYNHYQSYQSEQNYQHSGESQYPIVTLHQINHHYHIKLPPYANNCASNGVNGQACYGSMNQGYYHSSQSHPFYNAPYHNYQQIPHEKWRRIIQVVFLDLL